MGNGAVPAVIQMPFPNEAVSFDTSAFDNAVSNHGVRMVHYRSMRSPLGMEDMYDLRKPNDEHAGASNGFIYRKAGELIVLFSGNSKQQKTEAFGEDDGSVATVTLPRFYDNTNTPVRLTRYDRLFLIEGTVESTPVLVPNWQLFTASATGFDRLTYPVVQVEHIIDSAGIEYTPNDYDIVKGQIHWTGGRRPAPGTVYTIRYLFKPYWYVSKLLNELRLAPDYNPVTGQKNVKQMSQRATLVRERVFENMDRNAADPNNPRQVQQSEDGGFGPR